MPSQSLRRPTLGLLLTFAACSSGADAAPDPPVTLAPTDAYAGSTLTFHSVALRGKGNVGHVRFSNDSVPVVRINDTTVTVAIPAGLQGAVSPVLDVGSFSQTFPPITVYGYDELTTYPFQVAGDVSVWPRDGADAHVMSTGGDGVIRIVDLDTHVTTPIPGLLNDVGAAIGLVGPGFSYRDSVFFLQPADSRYPNNISEWRLLPTVTGSAPSEVTGSAAEARHVMQLGPDKWFAGSKRGSALFTADVDSAFGRTVYVPAIDGVAGDANAEFVSPRRDRATLGFTNAPDGVPVFSMPQGEIVYRVSQIHRVSGADFSPNGTRLLIADSRRLVELNASSGVAIHDTLLSDGVMAASYDRFRPLIYVAVAVPDPADSTVSHPGIIVIDRDSFRPLGEMVGSALWGSCSVCMSSAAAVVASQSAVYFFAGRPANTTTVWRFTLPPGPAP